MFQRQNGEGKAGVGFSTKTELKRELVQARVLRERDPIRKPSAFFFTCPRKQDCGTYSEANSTGFASRKVPEKESSMALLVGYIRTRTVSRTHLRSRCVSLLEVLSLYRATLWLAIFLAYDTNFFIYLLRLLHCGSPIPGRQPDAYLICCTYHLSSVKTQRISFPFFFAAVVVAMRGRYSGKFPGYRLANNNPRIRAGATPHRHHIETAKWSACIAAWLTQHWQSVVDISNQSSQKIYDISSHNGATEFYRPREVLRCFSLVLWFLPLSSFTELCLE
eukprot:gene57-34_t